MTTPLFCTDADLIQWEPKVLEEATFASQTLIAGTGDLSGSTFTISAGSFITSAIAKDHVIVIGGDSGGCFPILSVESDTALTLTVLYDGITDSDPEVPSAPAVSGSLSFAIRTFWPQRAIISELLSQAAGIQTAREGQVAPAILNPTVLRRPCALGTLQMIYSALAAASPDDAHFGVRAQLYERLYRRALRGATVDVDLNGDGVSDAHRNLSVLNFRRA